MFIFASCVLHRPFVLTYVLFFEDRICISSHGCCQGEHEQKIIINNNGSNYTYFRPRGTLLHELSEYRRVDIVDAMSTLGVHRVVGGCEGAELAGYHKYDDVSQLPVLAKARTAYSRSGNHVVGSFLLHSRGKGMAFSRHLGFPIL